MSASLPPSSPPDWLTRLAARARRADGHPPFSDQALVDAAGGAKRLVAIGQDAAAIVSDAAAEQPEAELVVDPDSRGRGLGTALLQQIARPGMLVWSHGDLPAARALAARFGASPVRRLLQLRAAVGAEDGHREFPTFRPGTDEAEWVALNARVFASHAEQGSVDVDDLLALEREPWFDASAFLLARDDAGRMTGYCWLKVEHGVGEIYVIGTERRGTGEGAALLDAGLALLAERGIRESSLYVEADNEAALRLYARYGYAERAVDVQYRLP